MSRLGPALGLKPVQDEHAFAKFMENIGAATLARAPVQLPSKPLDISAKMAEPELDELALLISELGP